MSQTEEFVYSVVLPLDEKYYTDRVVDTAFLKSQTGIQDDETLKQHILAVQAKAYAVRKTNA